MNELIEKKIFEIVTACRQARIEIGLHDLDPEGRNKVIDEMLHRAIIKANELEAAMKPRPIESAPKDGNPILMFFEYGVYGGWRVVQFDEGGWADHSGRYVEGQPSHWVPLPSDGGEE